MFILKTERKKLGSFRGGQLVIDNHNVMKRIPSHCENGLEASYELWKEGPSLFFIMNPLYYIICTNCGDKMELDPEEYVIIKKITKLNNKLVQKRIDDFEYQRSLDKILKDSL